MFLHSFFKGFFKNIVFRTVALVTKKLWAILDYFPQTRHFPRPVPNTINKKNPLNYYSFKVKYFLGDSVKNESATTKNYRGGGRQTPPQPV